MTVNAQKVDDLSFRDVYQQVLLVNRAISDELGAQANIPVNADAALVYGCINSEGNLCFEVLAPASFQSGKVYGMLGLHAQNTSLAWNVEDLANETEFKTPEDASDLSAFFANDIAAIENKYVVDPGRAMTRTMKSLDDLRDKTTPDNVSVVLGAEERNAEEVWFQLLGVTGDPYLIGKLVSEPEQDFGIHKGQAMILLPDETANRPRLLTSPDCMVELQ